MSTEINLSVLKHEIINNFHFVSNSPFKPSYFWAPSDLWSWKGVFK